MGAAPGLFMAEGGVEVFTLMGAEGTGRWGICWGLGECPLWFTAGDPLLYCIWDTPSALFAPTDTSLAMYLNKLVFSLSFPSVFVPLI